MRNYNLVHKESNKHSQKLRYLKNREKHLDYARTYRKENINKIKVWYEKNRETNRIKALAYYYKHKDDPGFKVKCYKRKKKLMTRLYSQVSQCNLRSPHKIHIDTLQRVFEINILKFGILSCYLCFKPVNFGDDSIDHLIPLSRGGDNSIENLGITHRSCNCEKQNKTPEEYKEWKKIYS